MTPRSEPRGEHLYDLLPRIVRRSDAEAGGALEALLGVFDGELDELVTAVGRAYDNLFVDTCEATLLPRIAALIDAAPTDGST